MQVSASASETQVNSQPVFTVSQMEELPRAAPQKCSRRRRRRSAGPADEAPTTSNAVQAQTDWQAQVTNTPVPNTQQQIFEQCKPFNPSIAPASFLYPDQGNLVVQWALFMLVAPLTLLTPMNLEYQIYLMEIFHTCIISRGIHAAGMPFITFAWLLIAAYFEVPFIPDTTPHGTVNLFAVRGNTLLILIFFVWYMVWGFRAKMRMFGVFAIPHLIALWILSTVLSQLTRYSPEEATWYASAPFWANPIILGLVFAVIVTASHTPEPLPPRMNGTNGWMDMAEYKARHNLYYRVTRIGQSFIAGTISEFLAGPRLMPLFILRGYFVLGFEAERWDNIQQFVKMAWASGNPALDYIGVGGSLPPLRAGTPQTLADAQQELKELVSCCEGKGESSVDEEVRKNYLCAVIQNKEKEEQKEDIQKDLASLSTVELNPTLIQQIRKERVKQDRR